MVTVSDPFKLYLRGLFNYHRRNVSACAPAVDKHAFGRIQPGIARSAWRPDEVGSLQLRRSVDGGKTWGPMQSLAVGNIDFYTATVAAGGKRVVIMLQVLTAPQSC